MLSDILLDKCRTDVFCKGDLSILQAMLVVYKPNQAPEHACLPYEVIMEVWKSIREYGLQALFTMNFVQATGESFAMTPPDWRSVLRTVLPSAQCTFWAPEYKELVQVMERISAGLGIGENELLGQENYATGAVQAVLPRAVFTQAADLTLKPLRKVPDLGRQEMSFIPI